MKISQFCAVALFLSIPAMSQQPSPETRVGITPEEYTVYAAVVKQLSADGLIDKPLISDKSSTFQCWTSCNGMLIGKCSGMRSEDQTAREFLEGLRKQFPSLKKETTADFEDKNQECAQIQKALPLSTRYFLFSQTKTEDLPKAWQHPDMVYFSRVGFDPGRAQALVYIALFSGTDAAHSGGTYILAKRDGTNWKVEKRLRVWDLLH